MTCINL